MEIDPDILERKRRLIKPAERHSSPSFLALVVAVALGVFIGSLAHTLVLRIYGEYLPGQASTGTEDTAARNGVGGIGVSRDAPAAGGSGQVSRD